MKIFFILFMVLTSITQTKAQFDSIQIKKSLQKQIKPVLPSRTISTTILHPDEVKTEPEPEYIFGYCAWVDPITGRKHLRMGRNRTTGVWEYVLAYPRYTIKLTNRNDGRTEILYFGAGGRFHNTVDSVGNETRDIRYIVAYKYKFMFNFNRAFIGIPYTEYSNGTINYNPDTWRFVDITVNWGTPDNIEVPLADYPVLPLRWTRKLPPFSDLPDF